MPQHVRDIAASWALQRCRNEVTSTLNKFYPLAGLFCQPLNPSDSDYQDTSPSSGESLQSNLPTYKTAPGYTNPLILHLFKSLAPVLIFYFGTVVNLNPTKGLEKTNRLRIGLRLSRFLRQSYRTQPLMSRHLNQLKT